MFQEEEPGKPQNWCFTVAVISIISLINVIIFVVIRVLLDTEDEFDEPIIDGELREDLTQFLGFFALSFCFGCWCCFCCNGKCFRCLYFLNPKRWRFGHWWAIFIGHQFIHTKNEKQKSKEDSDQLNLKEFSTLENSRDHLHDVENGAVPKNDRRGRQKISRISETDYDIERKVSPIFMSSNLSKAMEDKCEIEDENYHKPISFVATENKDSGMENKQMTMPWCSQSAKAGIRRWSLAYHISSENLIKMIEEREGSRGLTNISTSNSKGKENPAYEIEDISP